MTLDENKVEQELNLGNKLSIVNLVNFLIERAYLLRASDIHIDPEQDKVRIRMRIDGALQDEREFPKNIYHEVIARIKILAGLRTDEHQASQDGRFQILMNSAIPLDVRVSIAPTYYGENADLRLLSDKSEEFTLNSLGFTKENQKKILWAVSKPYGMILATGPTGSGKTTTLYTILKTLNKPDVSIITIEEPIEYSILGINQIGVNPRTGLTFSNGLRSILRQDPNIIMVGEIRDTETAGLAVNTALTGHLLLSTLHTNDAATTLPRLLDMKIEPYLIASTVNIAIGQRLVRKICGNCKVKKVATVAEKKSLQGVLPLKLNKAWPMYEGLGCEECNRTGYKGRICIQEVLVMDDLIREAVLKKSSAAKIRDLAIRQGMTTMMQDGMNKVLQGITTIKEVLRMFYE